MQERCISKESIYKAIDLNGPFQNRLTFLAKESNIILGDVANLLMKDEHHKGSSAVLF